MVTLIKISNYKMEREIVRTFIAIDLPEAVVKKIEGIISYLKTQTPSKAIKWVSAENLHLTLKFLGEVPESKLEQIKTLTLEAVQGISPFVITVEGLGMYPNYKNPRVIWLGIKNEKPLVSIAVQLDQILTSADIPREKRAFSPHLTIGRIRRRATPDEVIKVGATVAQFKVDRLGDVPVETIRLYQSDLKPQGPIYSPLFDIPLNKV
jgi:2'-5' RNA ligase